jgi:hypothetical protein
VNGYLFPNSTAITGDTELFDLEVPDGGNVGILGTDDPFFPPSNTTYGYVPTTAGSTVGSAGGSTGASASGSTVGGAGGSTGASAGGSTGANTGGSADGSAGGSSAGANQQEDATSGASALVAACFVLAASLLLFV